MKVEHEKIHELYRILSNEKCRSILKFIESDGAKSFTEIMSHLGYEGVKERRTHTNLTSYYLKRLKNTYILRHDRLTSTYYLTRIGIRVLDMIEQFENFYTQYDMNDVNQDGFVQQVAVVRMREQ